MYNIKKNTFLFIVSLILLLSNASFLYAENVVNLDASKLIARAEISVNPSSATFTEGSTFEVPILLNTKGQSMNAIDLNLKFDPNMLTIIKPSTGRSIIGIWVQPPKYDNTNGTASFVGTVPGGIVSDSALIITITFQAKNTGTTEIRVLDSSNVLANDGLGSQAILTSNRGVYTILPKSPGGLTIYSDTHQFQDHWYNNNSPTLAWNKDPKIVGFSYILDNKPNTIPDNKNVLNETSKSYQDLTDGLWYFHIKSLNEGGAWGTTTNYLLRIDTTPPAKFKPKVDYISTDNIDKALVSFFSTDSLSGIDHYEIGVIDKTQGETSSPIFVRSESPYQVPLSSVANSRVIIRAYDMAGNSTDIQTTVRPPTAIARWFTNNSSIMLLLLLILLVLLYLTHYLWGHRVLKRLKLISHLLQGKKGESLDEVVKEVEQVEEAMAEKVNQNQEPEIVKIQEPVVKPIAEETKIEIKPVLEITQPRLEIQEPKPEIDESKQDIFE